MRKFEMIVNLDVQSIVTIVVAIFGSTGFWQWISSVSNKSVKYAIEELRKELDRMKNDEEQKEIRSARRRILRFNDELLNHRDLKHSKEMFDDVLDDASNYKKYCLTHPEFQNGKAVFAIENVERVYRKCLEENTFI